MIGIERGIVKENLNGFFRVVSLDRAGIVSPGIRALCGEAIQVGDTVYFFLFPDGDGGIIGKVKS